MFRTGHTVFSRVVQRAALVGMLVGVIACVPGLSPLSSVGAQAGPDVKALAVRFIAPAVAGPNGQPQSADLIPGALPPDLPVMLPLPAGANLVGSVTRKFGGASASWEMAYDASGSLDDLTAFYTNQLGTRGWTAPPSRAVNGAGFSPATQASAARGTFCKGSDGPYLAVNVVPTAGGPTDLRVFVSASSGGVCSGAASAQGMGPQGPLDRLPALSAPAGATIVNPNGSVGTGKVDSTAVATASATAVDLEAAFAAQLTAAGWTKTGGASASPLSYSVWTVPGDGNYQGYLSVLELPGGNVRDLYLSVTSSAAAQG